MYRWLFRNKIQVYEYPKNVLHGKIAAYDHQWMTVGSYNVNNISAYASIELNLDVKDEVFASSVHEKLEHIIREECVRITEEEYVTHYHYFQRLIQYISYEIVRLIFWMFTFYFRRH
jgi:cardiolipin synthase